MDYLKALLHIARDAGAGIMRIYDEMARTNQPQWTHKADSSPLTQADLQAHLCLVAGLTRLTPEIPVVSEEDGASWAHRTMQGQFWLIDPLDGTKEFITHSDEFTVNIALIRDGVAVMGVVFAPALDLAYWGMKGHGAYRECLGVREPVHVAEPGEVVRVVASKSHLNTETSEFISRLGAHTLIQAGSSLKFCRVADGYADIYPRLAPTCEWDTAAAQAVLEAAGGYVVSVDGQVLRYGGGDVFNPSFIATAMPLSHFNLKMAVESA